MSARLVADMLALAYDGFTAARDKNDEALRRDSVRLVSKALSHRDAGTFFSALQLALAEIHESPLGNDPELENNEDGDIDTEDTDEDSDSASPAYEGLVNGDEEEEGGKPDPEKEQGSVAKATANWKRLHEHFLQQSKVA